MSVVEKLDERQLNRTALVRQMLLQRTSASVSGVLERMGGLQAQYAPSSYIGLWSRKAGFRREDLDDAFSSRSVIQGTLMRTTIHLVSAADYHLFAAGIRQSRRSWFLRATKPAVTDQQMAAYAAETRRLLTGGPLKRADLVQALGLNNYMWVGVGLWVDMVRVPPSGTWDHRRADIYGLAEQWLEPSDPSPEEGVDHLIRRYLAAFGPASVNAIESWSGLTLPEIKGGVGRLDLRTYTDDAGKILYDVPDGELADPETEAPVRLFGTWEALLLAHARSTGILPEEHRPLVFHTKNPQSVNSFTVDGRVAGSWKLESGAFVVNPFTALTEEVEEGVRKEGEALAFALS